MCPDVFIAPCANKQIKKQFSNIEPASHSSLPRSSEGIFSINQISTVLNPKDISKELQKMAVSIPGIRPGVETTFYLKQIMQRVTYLGAIMLSILATIPNFIEAIIPGSSFNGLGTTSLLILVGVILDLSREIRSIILSNIYNEMFE